MKKYCPNCQKEFEFTVKSMADLENLTCPECNGHIDKNSRKPDDGQTDRIESNIGAVFGTIFHFMFIFYIAVSAVGVVGYFTQLYPLEYWCAGICLGVYFLQLIVGYHTFPSGIFFLPAGAVAGWLILKTVPGAVLGVLAVFIIRHVLRDIVFAILRKLIKLGNS